MTPPFDSWTVERIAAKAPEELIPGVLDVPAPAPSTSRGLGGVARTQAAMLDGGIDQVSDSEHPVAPLVDGIFLIAAADGRPRLLMSICQACGTQFFPPRERCSICSEAKMKTVEAPPQGELYTWTVIRELGGLREGFEPYVVG
jgi:hypothetical protein